MIRHDTYIKDYDWDVTLFYNAKPRDTSYIMRELWKCGIPAENYYEASHTLSNGKQNQGLTYNNSRDHRSIIVIGHVSDVWELIDTVEHEGRHLIQGICNAYGINPNSERAAYMEGRAFKQIFKEVAYGFGGMLADTYL